MRGLCVTAKSAARLPQRVNSLHYRAAALLSASPQLAESIRAAKGFRVVPFGDLSRCSKVLPLLDDLVGDRYQVVRDHQPKRLRGFEIDQKLEFRRLFDRNVGGLGTLQDLVNNLGSPTEHLLPVWFECQQPSFPNILFQAVQGGDPIVQREIDDLPALRVEEEIGNYEEHVGLVLQNRGERGRDVARYHLAVLYFESQW